MRLFSRRDNPDENPMVMDIDYGYINTSVGSVGQDKEFSSSKYGIQSFGIDRFESLSRVARFDVSTYNPEYPNMLTFVIDGLPTSNQDLPPGTV